MDFLQKNVLLRLNLGKFSENDGIDEIDIEQVIQKPDESMFDNWGHAFYF